MNIVFLDTKTMGNVPNLDLFKQFGNTTFYDVTPAEQTIERSKDADIIITCKVIFNQEVITQLPNLKLICIAATGTNNVDLDFAAKAGVVVKNVSNYSSHSVAQSTFAFVLALLNHTLYYNNYVKSGQYAQNDMFTHMGRSITELNNKVYGIIGLGAIGQKVAAIATAFGCRVVYFSTSGKNMNAVYESLRLTDLLKTSDVVSIHCPLNNDTHNLINAENIGLMKPTAILINMARGGIVEEAALANALNNNLIAGAAFDVFSTEPVETHNPLLQVINTEKILLAPHSAWASLEARTLLIEKIRDNIESFLKNHK